MICFKQKEGEEGFKKEKRKSIAQLYKIYKDLLQKLLSTHIRN